MKYSITGARKVGIEEYYILKNAIAELSDASLINTGAARGVDTIAAIAVSALHPKITHHILVPDAPHNESIYKYGEPIFLEKGIANSNTEAYRIRNLELVSRCDVLIAFPKTSKEERRSGTWMTIRMARKAEKEVRIFPLKGE